MGLPRSCAAGNRFFERVNGGRPVFLPEKQISQGELRNAVVRIESDGSFKFLPGVRKCVFLGPDHAEQIMGVRIARGHLRGVLKLFLRFVELIVSEGLQAFLNLRLCFGRERRRAGRDAAAIRIAFGSHVNKNVCGPWSVDSDFLGFHIIPGCVDNDRVAAEA